MSQTCDGGNKCRWRRRFRKKTFSEKRISLTKEIMNCSQTSSNFKLWILPSLSNYEFCKNLRVFWGSLSDWWMSGADKLALPFWRGDLKLLKNGRNLILPFELATMKDFKVKVWVKQLQLQCELFSTSKENDPLNVTTSGHPRSELYVVPAQFRNRIWTEPDGIGNIQYKQEKTYHRNRLHLSPLSYTLKCTARTVTTAGAGFQSPRTFLYTASPAGGDR